MPTTPSEQSRRRRRVLKLDDGVTRVEGFDVGEYPRHHFAFVKGADGGGWPMWVHSAGDDEWIRGCLRRRTNAQELALELVVSGTFRFTQGGREHLVGPGHLWLIRPGEDIEMQLETPGVGLKKVMEVVGPLVPTILSLTGLGDHDVVKPADVAWVTRQFDRAAEALRANAADSARMTSVIPYEVLVEMSRSVARAAIPTRLRQIVEYMEVHPGDRLSVERLCQMTKLSQSTLHRLFVEHFGVPPIAYFINLKMQIAQSLLAGSHHPIKVIARQLGYANQLYFSSEFKKRVGVSPRAYRARTRFAASGGDGGDGGDANED